MTTTITARYNEQFIHLMMSFGVFLYASTMQRDDDLLSFHAKQLHFKDQSRIWWNSIYHSVKAIALLNNKQKTKRTEL